MSNYYYTLASLPMLFFNEAPHISRERFEAVCTEQLDGADMKLLFDARFEGVSEDKSRNPVYSRYKRWEISLRNELAKLRGQSRGMEFEKFLIPGEGVIGIEDLAKETFTNPSPYEGMLKLYSARWEYLEELGINQFFNLEALTVYYLKLQILEKLLAYTKERGTAGLKNAYKKIREAADEGGVDENEI